MIGKEMLSLFNIFRFHCWFLKIKIEKLFLKCHGNICQFYPLFIFNLPILNAEKAVPSWGNTEQLVDEIGTKLVSSLQSHDWFYSHLLLIHTQVVISKQSDCSLITSTKWFSVGANHNKRKVSFIGIALQCKNIYLKN